MSIYTSTDVAVQQSAYICLREKHVENESRVKLRSPLIKNVYYERFKPVSAWSDLDLPVSTLNVLRDHCAGFTLTTDPMRVRFTSHSHEC